MHRSSCAPTGSRVAVWRRVVGTRLGRSAPSSLGEPPPPARSAARAGLVPGRSMRADTQSNRPSPRPHALAVALIGPRQGNMQCSVRRSLLRQPSGQLPLIHIAQAYANVVLLPPLVSDVVRALDSVDDADPQLTAVRALPAAERVSDSVPRSLQTTSHRPARSSRR
jgi:hypothetical protein